jgi:protein-L-isoaspartate(D-aspartate) O-methyltransferase
MLDRRLHMVNSQLRTGGVVDKVVLAAFLEVPRQRFVAPEHESLAYLDRELPARGAKFRRLLTPMGLARMLQAATIVPSDRARCCGRLRYGCSLASMGAKVVLGIRRRCGGSG